MKRLLLIGLVCLPSFWGCSSETNTQVSEQTISSDSTSLAKPDAQEGIKDQILEVSCGQCQLGMTGGDCDLAVRIDGKSYFVDGSSIDDHGDAHGENGLCNCIRSAKVSGEIKDGRFVATAIEVLPDAKVSD